MFGIIARANSQKLTTHYYILNFILVVIGKFNLLIDLLIVFINANKKTVFNSKIWVKRLGR